jgi:hypothetical protein
MDEIKRSQIGKRSEPLQGWEDQPKKGIGTNYPPMRAKGAKGNRRAFLGYSNNRDWSWFWIFVILGVVGMIIAKLLGYW